MRIGIDCRTILNPDAGEQAGVGHYTYFLVKHLLSLDRTNHYVLFFDHRLRSLADWKRKNTTVVRFPYSQYKRYLPYAYSHVFVSHVLQRARLDLFHGPANILPMQYRRPAIVTVHDLAIYQHPEWFPPKQDFSIKRLVPSSIAKARRIIAVSQSTARDLRRQFAVPNERLAVIYEGHQPTKPLSKLARWQVLRRFNLQDKFLLYIGTLEPRKNISGIIAAYERLVRRHPRLYKNVQLVLAGAKGYRFADTYRAIQAVQAGSVRYLGYLSADLKSALLQSAEVFVFPSFYEGFGLPVLEAMAAGTPVITSNCSSLPEVTGKAAYLIDPHSTAALERAMNHLLKPSVNKCYWRLGKQQAAQFTWEQCAKQTLAVYKTAVIS